VTITVVLALAVGTFAFRFAGPLLRDRISIPERIRDLLALAAIALLVTLVAVNALVPHGGFSSWALPVGVSVGGVAAWRKRPLVVVVVLAAATTAALRLLGVS
jgi:branched-subunit amino acid transport protein